MRPEGAAEAACDTIRVQCRPTHQCPQKTTITCWPLPPSVLLPWPLPLSHKLHPLATAPVTPLTIPLYSSRQLFRQATLSPCHLHPSLTPACATHPFIRPDPPPPLTISCTGRGRAPRC